MKKALIISNSVLLAVNVLILVGLLWFGNRNTPVAYARVAHVSHQQNELESLNAELAAQKQAQQQR